YCNDNQSFMPAFNGAGGWPWDIPVETANVLCGGAPDTTAPGIMKRKIIYDPGSHADVVAKNLALWPPSRGTPIIGYTYLGWRPQWDPDLIRYGTGGQAMLIDPAASGYTGEIQRKFVRKINMPAPGLNIASTEIVADATPAVGGPPGGPYDFYGMPNSGMVGAGMGADDHSHSAHMHKRRPDGANVLFGDSHVQW